MKKGLLIILSGPSGVGKGTIRKKLMDDPSLNLFFSVSMTTRLPRNGEIDGKDYYFVSKEEFQRNIDNGNFLEWAEFVGNRYGTPKDKVEAMRKEGKNVLLEIEVNGTMEVLSKVEDAISIFLLPPSMEALESRIRGRSTESDEIIAERLEKARREIPLKDHYSKVVINDDAEKAAMQIKEIILQAMGN